MELFTILCGILAILTIWLIRHCTKHYGSLEALGIPVIKPFLCFGSPPFGIHKVTWHQWYHNKHRDLGRTFGQYVGSTRVITTTDPDIVKALYVKNFEEFGDMVDGHYDDKLKTIDIAQGQEWKNIRKILSPTFTSGKLKSMLEPIGDVSDKAMKHLEAKCDEGPIGMKKFFQGYAMDSILKCAFGLETNAHENQDHPLSIAGREAFVGMIMGSWLESIFALIMYFFPGLEATFPTLMYPEAFFKLHDITEEIIKERIASKTHHGDFIDKIIEVCNDPNSPVSKEMIKAQGSIFFSAGFETTSNCLSTLCYHLALNPDIQEKLREEILGIDADDEINHENISELHYLEAAILENLRIFPPLTMQARICKKDAEIKGLNIKKGTYVQVSIYATHHDPEFFPEPQMFKPERFLKENAEDLIPYTFQAFSGGPRVCLGQRFAMAEMKICMAKLMRKFRIKTCPTTDLKFLPGSFLGILGFEEIFLTLEPRN